MISVFILSAFLQSRHISKLSLLAPTIACFKIICEIPEWTCRYNLTANQYVDTKWTHGAIELNTEFNQQAEKIHINIFNRPLQLSIHVMFFVYYVNHTSFVNRYV